MRKGKYNPRGGGHNAAKPNPVKKNKVVKRKRSSFFARGARRKPKHD